MVVHPVGLDRFEISYPPDACTQHRQAGRWVSPCVCVQPVCVCVCVCVCSPCVCVCVCVCVVFSLSRVQPFATPINCSPPGSSVRGISQARTLAWAATSFSRGSSRPRDRTHICCLVGRFLTTEPAGRPRVAAACRHHHYI